MDESFESANSVIATTTTTPQVPQPSEDQEDQSKTVADARDDVASMRAQLLALQQQVQIMTAQMSSNAGATQTAHQPYQSREYWSHPIANTSFPGENAKFSSKRAYKQRLDAYLRKSWPIWKIATQEDPCPVTTDTSAMQSLTTALGANWAFDISDISSTMQALQLHDINAFRRVQAAMDVNADTQGKSGHGDRGTQPFTLLYATHWT